MRSFGFVLAAIIGSAAAVDPEQCTKSNSGSCCQGYTYNDQILHKRTSAPTCDGTSIPPYPGLTPPTCGGPPDSNGNAVKPVCTSIDTIPSGSWDGTLYCGNPLANTGAGTTKGSFRVEIGSCPAPGTGFCFIFTATAPAGTTLKDDYKVLISTSEIKESAPGQFPVKVTTAQPVYYPMSLVYGTTTNPCSTEKKIFIAFHADNRADTCWAGANTSPKPVTGGNSWALQFDFTFSCKEVCKTWCCCPPPPTIPDCPSDYTQSCPGKCSPDKPATCTLLEVPNPSGGWTSNPYYADKCCCKPPDSPHCPSGTEHTLAPGASTCAAFGSNCGTPIFGQIAECGAGSKNGVCCCCTPKQCAAGTTTAGACPATPPAGQVCTEESDGCGGRNCCCQPAPTGPCTTDTAYGVPNECPARTVCGTNTLQSEGCSNKWGWYLVADLSGSGSATYRLHAGAGQNDLRKGGQAGTVTVQACSTGSTQYCAFFTTSGGYVLTTAHVEATCDALSTRTSNNFPCAPGGYNLNGGGTCGSNGLPGTSWKSQPLPDCPSKKYALIFHAAVSKDAGCTATSCGNPDA